MQDGRQEIVENNESSPPSSISHDFLAKAMEEYAQNY
jgi:hypothetical protein